MNEITFKQVKELFKSFESKVDHQFKSVSDRLNKVEDALAIIGIDNKKYSESIIELNLKLAQSEKDISAIATNNREREAVIKEREDICSRNNVVAHIDIDTRITAVEKDVNMWKGIAIVIPICIGIIISTIQFMKGK